MSEGIYESIGEETMRDKAKPSLDAPDALGDKDFFLDHDRLLLNFQGRALSAFIHQRAPNSMAETVFHYGLSHLSC